MKNFFASNKFEIFYATFVIAVALLFGNTIKQEKLSLHGKWLGEYPTKKIEFDFRKDGTCILNFTDRKSGESFLLNGRYELDFSKKPIAVSIKKIPQLSYSLYTIVEFINRDKIMMEYFDSRWRLRPVAFNANTSMILKRSE